MRKRRVLILLLCALLALGLAGCGGGETPSGSGDAAPAEGETLTVVATIFPAYDWIRNLVGDVENVDVRLLCGELPFFPVPPGYHCSKTGLGSRLLRPCLESAGTQGARLGPGPGSHPIGLS